MFVGTPERYQRDEATPNGYIDHSGLTNPELLDVAPYYAYRILHGATPFMPWGSDKCELRSCGHHFNITKTAYEAFSRIADRVRVQMQFQGLLNDSNHEDTIRILSAAKRFASAELMVQDHRLRVLFLCANESGCGFYRSIQPFKWLRNITNTPIWAEMTDYLSVTSASSFDMIIAPRFGAMNVVSMLQAVMNMGRLVVYETDDLLSDIPSWNPAKTKFAPGDEMRRAHLIRNASACLVSTEELKNALGRPEVTHVCHNGIDPNLWPMQCPNQDTDCVRILWAGSDTHEHDLRQVTNVIKGLIKRYTNRVKFVFVGYAPDEFRWIYNDTAKSTWGIKPEYAKNIEFYQGCKVYDWPAYLAARQCHIAIAPLVTHPFNESKSELKVLEAWAMGIPIVASSISPYRRAIDHGVDGLLADSDVSWDVHLDNLIRRPDMRTRIGRAGLEALKSKGYLMETIAGDYERALLSIARGKTQREACNVAIEARLNELGGAR